MRLINVQTLELEEFFDLYVPEYAILSHTWGDGEVSLQDWANRENRRFKPGFLKISKACEQAAKDSIGYLWVDTNCIDKTSSAELSEAINSMFKWYRISRVCYAHLDDVSYASLDACKEQGSEFRQANWFNRGWTLQELIAPEQVRFFAKDWQELGNRAQLALTITETTGIGFWCLVRGNMSKINPLRGYSIAQRLSWASRRATTRIEDRAYSLLGLFDIHMPLVYGEGHEAFSRLLEEIIRKYADHSIFASQLRYVDFLPRSPKDFCDSQYVNVASSLRLKRFYNPDSHPYPFQMTNTGLQMTLPLVATISPDFVFGVLQCWDVDSEINQSTRVISRIWIPLRRKGPRRISQFARLMWPQVFVPVRLLPKEVAAKVSEPAEMDGLTEKLGDETESKEVIDLLTLNSYTNILIRKPYASTVEYPHWKQKHAGGPFLVCFPRGVADYRIFGIFPQRDASGKVLNEQTTLHLPLVYPGEITPAEDGEDGSTVVNGKRLNVFRAAIVFKKRQTRPPKFVAICLANLPDKKTGEYTPLCKIIPWPPPKEEKEGAPHVDEYRMTDVNEDIVVTVQKTPCASLESAPTIGPRFQRFLGLTQVLFDRQKLVAEVEASEKSDERADALMERIGQFSTDEDEP